MTVAKGGRGGKGNASMRHNKPNRFVSCDCHAAAGSPLSVQNDLPWHVQLALVCCTSSQQLQSYLDIRLQVHIASLSHAAESPALTQCFVLA